MQFNYLKASLKTAVLVTTVLLLGAGLTVAQQQVNLTAGPASMILPDGSTVPMWGYSCGTVVAGSAATCAKLNPAATGWSPIVITVPTGQGLAINLTNNLSFTVGSSTNKVPTSLMIVGQLGGGLGTTATSSASPVHPPQVVTWSTVGTTPANTPPPQGPRVQSFSTEVAAGATTLLPAWANLRPGTYLLESGTHPSIQGPMGLYGMLVVTAAPSTVPTPTAGIAYPSVSYDADVDLLLSEIDPVQNNAVQTAVNTAGFSETMVWSGQPGGCGNPSSGPTVYQTCYPPAVNYTPLYYLFNGVAFDKTNAAASTFPATIAAPPVTGTATGSVLVRFVNAGSRMHVPSIVGSQTGTAVAPAIIPPSGFSLIAEDGNPLPGLPRVQSEVFMAAGKTYDVMVNGTAPGATALPVYDRELSLSGNAIGRDAGMLAYISINGSARPASPALAGALANPDTYNLVAGKTLSVSDPSKGVISNDVNVYGVKVSTAPLGGTLTLNANGTFTYVPNSGTTSDSFGYCGNGATSGPACATVTLAACTGSCFEANTGITVSDISYTANVATDLRIKPPGVLSVDKDSAGYPLTVVTPLVSVDSGLTVSMDSNGGFNASVTSPGIYHFTYHAKNSQGTVSASTATVTLNFPTPSGLTVSVVDGMTRLPLTGQDYRWIIEEDKTFYIDPACTMNPPPVGCPTASSGIVPTFGVNFHTSNMPYVAQGCTGPKSCESGQTVFDPGTGTHLPAACDVGNGVCRTDLTAANGTTAVNPSQVYLDPAKRYYISVLPGDAGDPFAGGPIGHTMGGAPITFGQTSVTVLVEPTPLPTSKLSVFVFEDDFPLNGEQDAGGGIDVLASNEPGLGGFNIQLFDAMGGSGDFTGQMTYDMFNQPLSNSLAGTPDPATGLDACPISKNSRIGTIPDPNNPGQRIPDPNQTGITGMIVTCPKYESDGKTLSPLQGQAIIANLMPMRLAVVATPGADRIARGEEWLQTNTLDGQKAHDAFLRVGEPSYFQEFGPAGYHVTIGFANPKIINGRKAGVCAGTDSFLPNPTGCNNTVTGKVTTERMSRTPDERLYSSGSHDSFYFTRCFVSLGDPDGEDFAFTKCDDQGNFSLTGLPDGTWRVTVFDQWNDMLVDGLSTPVALGPANRNVIMPDIAMNQWQANVYTRTFIDDNKDGLSQSTEAGIPLINVTVRNRDGSMANNLGTDFNGIANFNETFPLFSWYVVETDTTRYKTTGTHVVYDAGGPADGTTCGTPYPNCGKSTIGKFLANTAEQVSVPADLRVPGAVYCDNADCTGFSIANGPGSSASSNLSTGRIDPPWVGVEGWQGFSGQNNFIEFGKTPYVPGENGGIHGHVVYASTRPFDDPQMLVQTQWESLIPHVTINLYQEGTAPDGSQSLTLVDTTQTSSWDDWAQGFRSDGRPNMNCPGQSTSDLFYFSLYNQPNYLDVYNSQHGGPMPTPLPDNSQFKCYDGMHNWNQIQPAPYDGMYKFPSILGINPTTGALSGTNCTVCSANPTDGTPMLPAGKYVVEVVVPPGYELVKEEDKNILIGDNYIAPVTQQFGGLGNVFILPDQAQIASSYNANNAQNPTNSFGASPLNGIVPGFVPEPIWPCVGQTRIVPDFISLFPQSNQISPFAGATRNLCDRKEVTLGDQSGAIAKFFLYTSTHIASKFTGVITDDFTSEFDPFSPQFGEKFSPPNMPISVKDWTGAEIARVYSDHWGTYNGMNYSTWEVNPPNPTGYSPTMMVYCMNDKGPIPDPASSGQMITDPLFNPAYSQFCYELPFMPGTTDYLDTPVVPTSAFAGAGYNNPDCNYPDATPAISEVDGDGIGPWVSTPGKAITIKALGNELVNNYGYSGPSAAAPPFNQKTITRHYGFGSQCTSPTVGSATCNTLSSVTIGGVAATITSWSDLAITVTAPATVPACALQQQAVYGGSSAQCGELVVTAGNGKQSIDTVTVTIGGKAPAHVTSGMTIQGAIDGAAPGDLIIVDPGTYNELLLMWKPVRLQGVGAASSVINANTHPAGKLDPWRAQVACLFGLALNGQPYSTKGNLVPLPGGGGNEPLNVYDPTGAQSCPGTGWNYFTGGPNNPQVDRLPLEGIVGWDTTVNGNLAQLMQEPTLMGAYEGAGITVLAKGVRFPAGLDVFGSGLDNAAGSSIAHESQMPVPTVELTNSDADCNTGPGGTGYPSNFQCNPSRIDGLSITNSSQGGGGIFVHAWGHNLEIANNRIYNNTGTNSGGITIGQGESPDALLSGNGGDPVGYNGGTLGGFDQQPWTCLPGAVVPANTPYGYDQVVSPPNTVANQQLPYCYDTHVNVHHNSISSNSSIGDELFSGTPAGAGGVTFCTGSDYYKFNYNWVCGNLSTGDGGGLAHLGFIWNGDIEHNSILFNQSTNPTIATNGGGMIIMSTAPDGAPTPAVAGVTECGSVTDVDCAPGLGDGTGPGLVINANLVMGNAAESGSGGGIRLQSVNGAEVGRFPNGNPTSGPSPWYSVQVTNNIIANNVAGWDGAGVSLQDSLAVNLINNTIMSNDTTASSGVLFNTLGAPLASAPGATNQTTSPTTSAPQPAGLVTMGNSSNLTSSFAGLTITCPTNHPNCRSISYPYLANDLFWQNRSYYIGVGAMNPQFQQNVVSLYNSFTTTLAPSQPQADATGANGNGVIITGGTGACTAASYWDIGVRGDTGPGNHSSGFTLAPTYSVLTNTGTTSENGTGTNNFMGTNPTVVSQYCNGARTPPELGSAGYQVPPGIADATVPNPIFNLTPAATVDEGNNWVNIFWGPLALTHPVAGGMLGNYAPAAGSPVIDAVASSSPTYALAPSTDFFGNPRPDRAGTQIDIGAVEVQGSVSIAASVAPTSLAFGNQLLYVGAIQTVTLSSVGELPLTISSITVTGTNASDFTSSTCPGTLASGASCTVSVTFTPTALLARTALLTIATNDPTNPTLTVALSGTGVAPIAGVNPGSLDFGNRAVNTTSTAKTVTLSNTGTAPLSIASIGVSDTTDYGLTTGCTGSLTAGASCTISVTFHPTTLGSKSATLTVTDNSMGVNNSTQTVSLSGTGLAPVLSVAPTSLNFNSPMGVTSAAQTVTVKNMGNAPLVINSITRTGTNANQFANPNSCPIGGTGLAAGLSCTVSVTFTPTTIGTKTASLNVNVAAPATSQSVSLTGTVPVLQLTPGSVTFPNTIVNATSALVPVIIKNTGTGPLMINSITTLNLFPFGSPNQFGQTNTCPIGGVGLAAGATCTVNVTFKPTSTGSKLGGMLVTGTALTTSGGSVLMGTGIAPAISFAIVPSPNWGMQTGATSRTFRVTNSGPAGANLSITSIARTGAANFQITGGTCGVGGVVNGTGGFCTVIVTFTPPTPAATVTGTLIVSGTGQGTTTPTYSTQTLSLSGR